MIDLTRVDRPVTEFVSLFRKASHVVTTSFHGIVFSIIFGVPFYAFPLWGGYDLRYIELLKSLGAEDRLVSYETELKPGPMDFAPLREALESRRKQSVEFLERHLQ